MVIKVLAIGDVGNIITTISKYTKKSKIYLVNFVKDGAGVFTYTEGIETFNTYKVSEQVKKINEIKDNFDICIVMGTGERVAYLADLNYIAYYVGRDIDAPRFVKNSREQWFNEPLHTLNFLERRFYKNSFDNAIAHVAYGWVFEHLKKYTKKGIKMDMLPIDPDVFNHVVDPLNRKKTKFTFFCPQRMDRSKGTELLWKALPLCKSDFEVLQVEWFGEATSEEKELKKWFLENMPSQVKLISMINRKDMPKYYEFSDAVLGNMIIGTYALIEFEGVLCKKPVIQYTNPNMEIILSGKKTIPPFLPYSNDPKTIAETIDKVVQSKEFRDKLFEEEFRFVKEMSDPQKIADWWDNLFEELAKQHKSIRKNSSKIRIKIRLWLFLTANRLYLKKLKILVKNI